jgi:flotillin
VFRAEGEKAATIAAAEATAEQARLNGEGERSRRQALAQAAEIEGRAEGAAEQARREAIAAAVEREGAAEAAAILAKGHAEAEAMDKRAEAFTHYDEAAVLDLVVKVLPELVRAAAEPLGNIDKMTVISTDGASQVARTVATNVEQGIQIGSDVTGVDLRGLLSRLAGRTGQGNGNPGASELTERGVPDEA